MGELKRKRGLGLFDSKPSMRSIGVAVGILGTIVLVCMFACQQTVGVRPSTTAPSKVSGKETVPALTNTLCVVCHPQQPETIRERGKKHKTEVGCLDCHREHPPEGADAIPQCSMCHSGKSHYELEGCSKCHSDAHAPLDLKLEGEITEPCLTCHQQQGDEVKSHPSAHTDLACNECHSVHGQIPSCMDCHEKHTEDMDFKACVSCHPVHMPLEITYPQDTPSHYCGACHEEALSLLEKNTTKHHNLACAFCHRTKHKVIPPCFACHASPHSETMLHKFPKCSQCHGTAHDLKA